MSKKVLIMTVQKAPNFGACLQAYALWKYISDLGHDCKIIDLLRPYHSDFVYTEGFDTFCKKERSWFLNFRIEYVRPFRKKLRNIFHKDTNNYNRTIPSKSFSQKLFDEFNEQLKYTKTYRSIGDLYSNPPQADLYITGSDQLWNPTQPYALEPYFLTFVKQGKKISYATSIGVAHISKYVKRKFALWIKSYDAISVREPEAASLLQPLVQKQISECCDPTFLLSKESWEKLASKRQIEGKYIFLFTVGDGSSVFDYAETMGKKLNLPVITNKDDFKKNGKYSFEIKNDIGPLEWLALIRDAEMVVTNSFHGCVFCLFMHTPFRVGISNNRGSRITNLLKQVHCENLFLNNNDELNPLFVDFETSDKCMKELGEKGQNYLLQYLKQR